jgi:hypothetical protein
MVLPFEITKRKDQEHDGQCPVPCQVSRYKTSMNLHKIPLPSALSRARRHTRAQARRFPNYLRMAFIFAGIIVFFAVKVAQSWDRHAGQQKRREYAALMRRIDQRHG